MQYPKEVLIHVLKMQHSGLVKLLDESLAGEDTSSGELIRFIRSCTSANPIVLDAAVAYVEQQEKIMSSKEHGGFDKSAYDAMIKAAERLASVETDDDIVPVLTDALEASLVEWFKREMEEARSFIDQLLDMDDIDPEHIQKLIGTAASDQMVACAMTLYVEEMIK